MCYESFFQKSPEQLVFRRIGVLCFYWLLHSVLPKDLIIFRLRSVISCRQRGCSC